MTFPHKEILKETWISPDRTTKNGIDYILIDARYLSSVKDVRTYWEADCYPYPMLVRAKIRGFQIKEGK